MLLPIAIRSIKFLIGIAFVGVLLWALLWTVVGVIQDPPAETAEHMMHKHPKELSLASDGMFGKFDKAQVQRGLKVFEKVCTTCHSLNFVSFREFAALGYEEAEIKKLAKDWPVKQPVFDAKTGMWGERDNVPADRLPKVYYSGNGSPPDLSMIAKSRHGGGAYIYSLLTGYGEKPSAEALEHFPEFKETPTGMYFNPYFANLNISMPEPITTENQVEYTDGTRATKDQMAKDVAAFLVWSAEPTMESRHKTGWAVLIFLLITTVLAFGAYRSVWAGTKH